VAAALAAGLRAGAALATALAGAFDLVVLVAISIFSLWNQSESVRTGERMSRFAIFVDIKSEFGVAFLNHSRVSVTIKHQY
jgi:hypothetical protein